MKYTLTTTYRTKSEAKEAIKKGETLHIVTPDGKVLDKANGGPWFITGKLAHYKEWNGEAIVWDGKVKRLT